MSSDEFHGAPFYIVALRGMFPGLTTGCDKTAQAGRR